MAGDWAYRGTERAKQDDEEKKRRRASGSEFFVKVGEQRDVLFLEDVKDVVKDATGVVNKDATICVFRHKLKVDGGWPPVSVTCTLDYDHDCEVCRKRWKNSEGKEQQFKRDLYWFVSILDLTPWRRDDRVWYASRRVLAMKRNLFERLRGKGDKRREMGHKDGLKMWAVNVRRVSELRGKQEVSWNTGNEFEPIAFVANPFVEMPFIRLRGEDGKDLGPHPGCNGPEAKPMDLTPEDWREYLKPPEKAELSALFREHSVIDSSAFKQGDGGAPEGAEGPATAAQRPLSY